MDRSEMNPFQDSGHYLRTCSVFARSETNETWNGFTHVGHFKPYFLPLERRPRLEEIPVLIEPDAKVPREESAHALPILWQIAFAAAARAVPYEEGAAHRVALLLFWQFDTRVEGPLLVRLHQRPEQPLRVVHTSVLIKGLEQRALVP